MIRNVEQVFADLLVSTEVRKVDYKRDQYLLDNEILKSSFVKDVVCMANALGDDGFILLGVKTVKGKPREVVGISHHYDSSELEAIVNGVIDAPIQFEYYPLKHQGYECALLHIPRSKAKPHWPTRDYGKLHRHIIYTRRSSGNREASTSEIREMYVETMQLSDIAQQKVRTTGHVVDELADKDLDDRRQVMYDMLKGMARKLRLSGYRLLLAGYLTRPICAVVTRTAAEVVCDYAVFMHPWTAKKDDLLRAHWSIENAVEGHRSSQLRSRDRARLRNSMLVHVSYRNIYTKALETSISSPVRGQFANAWNESWGRIMKWEYRIREWRDREAFYSEKPHYEFFLPNVASTAELADRLGKLLSWVDSNIL